MHAGHFFKINSRRQEQLEKGYVGSHITYSRRVHVLLYICTSPAVQCVLLVPQGPSGPIGWPQSRHTRQLCSCCGRCQLLPDLAAATGSFPFRWHAVGRGAVFLVTRGAICWSGGGLDIFRGTLLCVLARVFSCVSRERWRYQCCDWMFGTLGGAHRMNFE